MPRTPILIQKVSDLLTSGTYTFFEFRVSFAMAGNEHLNLFGAYDLLVGAFISALPYLYAVLPRQAVI